MTFLTLKILYYDELKNRNLKQVLHVKNIISNLQTITLFNLVC